MEPFGIICGSASCPAPWCWHLCHWLTRSSWFLHIHMHFEQTTDIHFGCTVPGASTRYPLSLYRTHLEQSSHALAGLTVQAVTNASGAKPYVGTRLCLPVPCSLTSYLANSVQTLWRLSQKDSWLSLCAAARIWEQFLTALWSGMFSLGNTTEGLMQIV